MTVMLVMTVVMVAPVVLIVLVLGVSSSGLQAESRRPEKHHGAQYK